ncbi:MAG: hypothetical protein V4666_09955 [Bacteroidota bacterium]
MNCHKKSKVSRFLRKKLIVIFFFANSLCFSQTSIHFDKQDKFPSELPNIKTWLIGFTNKISFRLGSFKESPKQDAALNIYTLRVGQPKKLEIGNSGTFIEFGSLDGNAKSFSIQQESKWKIMAYNPHFDLYKFKPSNNEEVFDNLLFILNISETQAMAEFLNRYISGDTENKIKKYVKDIEKKYKVKLSITDYDKVTLTELAQKIYAQTNKYSSTIGYELYIKNKDEKKCRDNINLFFRKYSPEPVNTFYDKITPEGKFFIEVPVIKLNLSDKDFLFVDELSKPVTEHQNISFSFNYLSYKIEYDDNQEPYIKLNFDGIKVNNEVIYFQIDKEEQLNKRLFPFSERRTFKTSEIIDITFHLYENRIETKMNVLNENKLTSEYVISTKTISYK